MSRVALEESYLENIASAIRAKNGQSATYKPSKMASAILSIKSAAELSIISKTFSQNGTYAPSSFSADAFANVVVDIKNIFTSADQGKVVSSGRLLSQTSRSVSENGVYDTTLNNNIIVSVPTGGGVSNGIDVAFIEGGISNINNDVITKVKECAFASDSVIRNVNLPNVSIIHSGAFMSTYSMEIANFPKCETIERAAFCYCYKLNTIDIPLCSIIGFSAFYNCSSLSTIQTPLCQSIGASAFVRCSRLKSINALSCSFIGSNAFYGCTSLESMFFPECSAVYQSAFYGCTNASYAYFPKCSIIDYSAFENCTNLSKVDIHNALTIHPYAFRSTALTEIRFENNVQLRGGVFRDCKKLESVYLLYESVISLGWSTNFDYTPIKNSSYLGYFGSIFVPESLVETYKYASNWIYYSERFVAYSE